MLGRRARAAADVHAQGDESSQRAVDIASRVHTPRSRCRVPRELLFSRSRASYSDEREPSSSKILEKERRGRRRDADSEIDRGRRRAARIVDNRREARTRDARRPDGGRSGRRTAMIPRSAPFATRAIDASRRKKKCARTRERARASSARGRTASARFQQQPFAVRPSPASGANDSPRRWAKAQRNSNPSR